MKRWVGAGAGAGALMAGGYALAKGARKIPAPFPEFTGGGGLTEFMDVPSGLPGPVARYVEVTCGDRLPVMSSAVITGRMTMRIKGLSLPGRWRFVHEVGTGYRHYMEVTVFGRTVTTGEEWYIDGHARLNLPGGAVENEPVVDRAANLGMWGEYLWLPSVLAQGQWQPIDEQCARLVVPQVDGPDQLVAWFDPNAGLIDRFEAMRWREAGDSEPVRWVTRNHAWTRFAGIGVPAVGSVQWADQPQPWLRLSIDDVVWNADVGDYLRASGV